MGKSIKKTDRTYTERGGLSRKDLVLLVLGGGFREGGPRSGGWRCRRDGVPSGAGAGIVIEDLFELTHRYISVFRRSARGGY